MKCATGCFLEESSSFDGGTLPKAKGYNNHISTREQQQIKQSNHIISILLIEDGCSLARSFVSVN